MKASRAYIAGLGTTGVLIASFVIAFVIVSAIVAFNGVPGQASSDRLDRVDVGRGSAAAALSRSARRAARLYVESSRGERDERVGARGTKARGRPARRRGGAGGAGAAEATGPSEAVPLSGSGTPAAGGSGLPALPADAGGGLPDLPEAPRLPPVGGATDGAGDVVNDVTSGVGGTVGGAAPGVGEALPQAGETVNGALDGAGQAVDDTAGGLPSLP